MMVIVDGVPEPMTDEVRSMLPGVRAHRVISETRHLLDAVEKRHLLTDEQVSSLFRWLTRAYKMSYVEGDHFDALYVAKLALYVLLSMLYEIRYFTFDQRLQREVRCVRHERLLAKWPVIGL